MRFAVEAALEGKLVLWCAPTHDQSLIGWDEAKKACQLLIDAGIVRFNKTEKRAYFPRGGMIRFVSLEEPDNARGPTAHLIILEEAGEIAEEAWTTVLRPVVASTKGDIWGIGTPKGYTWFKAEFDKAQRAMERERKEGVFTQRVSFNSPTLGAQIIDHPDGSGRRILIRVPHPLENPDFDWDEMVEMFEDMPERSFRQEILAEFIADAGGVFENVPAVCLLAERNREPVTSHNYQIGVDVARKTDFTVISVVDLTTFEQVYFSRFNKVGLHAVCDRIETIWQSFGGVVHIDSTGIGDEYFEQLHNRGVSVEGINFTNARKTNSMDHLAALIEKGRIRLQDIYVQRQELINFQYKTSDFGNKQMTAPKGMHDDCVTALALAVWGQRPIIEYAATLPFVGARSHWRDIPRGGW